MNSGGSDDARPRLDRCLTPDPHLFVPKKGTVRTYLDAILAPAGVTAWLCRAPRGPAAQV